MSHERSETHNPHDAAARLHDAVDERTAALRKSAKRWRKAGRREMRRLRREVEARARPVTSGAIFAGLTAFAALAGWAAWRSRRPDA